MRRADAIRATAATLLVAVAAGCGSTVPIEQSGVSNSTTGSNGALSMPSPTTSVAPASAGPGGAIAGPGGGATGPVPAGGTAAPAAPGGPVPTPGGPGGTRVTGPITVGLLYAVNDAAAPAGVNNGNTITPGGVMHAYVNSWNKSGGIGGRRIEPVYFGMHSYNNDYEQQIASACAAFIQDHHVSVVITELQYYSDQLLTCLGRADVPLFSGDFAAPDRQDAQRYPLFVTPMTQLGEERETSVVQHLAADGFLSTRNKVGVIVEDCPVDERIFSNGVTPALRNAHLSLASTFRTQCFQSVQDFGTQTSQMSSAVLQFRRAGVDRVMVVSAAAEANIVFAFSEVAENQAYRPGYALSSVAIPVALELNASPNQMVNMRGVGWLPVIDTASRSQSPPTSTGASCLNRLRAAGVSVQTQADRWTAYSACEGFMLYDALLRTTSGNADARAVVGALQGVIPHYVAAATIDGRLGIRDGRVTPTVGRIFAYDAKDQFHYTGRTFRL